MNICTKYELLRSGYPGKWKACKGKKGGSIIGNVALNTGHCVYEAGCKSGFKWTLLSLLVCTHHYTPISLSNSSEYKLVGYWGIPVHTYLTIQQFRT